MSTQDPMPVYEKLIRERFPALTTDPIWPLVEKLVQEDWPPQGSSTSSRTTVASKRCLMPDCGDNSCRYAPRPLKGMRTNGRCRCDDCIECGASLRSSGPQKHKVWCSRPRWMPAHHAPQKNDNDPAP